MFTFYVCSIPWINLFWKIDSMKTVLIAKLFEHKCTANSYVGENTFDVPMFKIQNVLSFCFAMAGGWLSTQKWNSLILKFHPNLRFIEHCICSLFVIKFKIIAFGFSLFFSFFFFCYSQFHSFSLDFSIKWVRIKMWMVIKKHVSSAKYVRIA